MLFTGAAFGGVIRAVLPMLPFSDGLKNFSGSLAHDVRARIMIQRISRVDSPGCCHSGARWWYAGQIGRKGGSRAARLLHDSYRINQHL